jgi:hypothetical protein
MCIGVYDLPINNKKDMSMNSKEIIARLKKEGWYKVGAEAIMRSTSIRQNQGM